VPRKSKSKSRPTAKAAAKHSQAEFDTPASALRVIGGHHRGRTLLYNGDPRTRPMKDRVREAVFNLLGPDVKGKHAWDWFAGTGALGLEALSRGSRRATFCEQHYPTAAVLQQNIAQLGLEASAEILTGDAFFCCRRMLATPQPAVVDPSPAAWLVFCSPPYDFYVDRSADMLKMIESLAAAAPAESLLVVESDERFDSSVLPQSYDWDRRTYPPACVAIGRKLPSTARRDVKSKD
jgi:16S rRNA (guanine966-N2)-methyltransferase